MKINVEYFQIQKSMLQTIRVEKVVCLVFMMPYEVIVLKSSKKVNILQFCADLSKNLNVLKKFTYLHLKGPVLHFQKIALTIML